jgi:hypothetical protein
MTKRATKIGNGTGATDSSEARQEEATLMMNEDRCRSARSSSAGYAKPRSALVMVGYCHRSSLSPPEPLGWDQRGIERNACIACVRRG